MWGSIAKCVSVGVTLLLYQHTPAYSHPYMGFLFLPLKEVRKSAAILVSITQWNNMLANTHQKNVNYVQLKKSICFT